MTKKWSPGGFEPPTSGLGNLRTASCAMDSKNNGIFLFSTLEGFEPPTFRLTAGRANLLRHRISLSPFVIKNIK
jgi:hypothetical protein